MIGALIDTRAEKLAQYVAMRTMNLNTVKTGLFCPFCSLYEILFELLNFSQAKCTRSGLFIVRWAHGLLTNFINR